MQEKDELDRRMFPKIEKFEQEFQELVDSPDLDARISAACGELMAIMPVLSKEAVLILKLGLCDAYKRL